MSDKKGDKKRGYTPNSDPRMPDDYQGRWYSRKDGVWTSRISGKSWPSVFKPKDDTPDETPH